MIRLLPLLAVLGVLGARVHASDDLPSAPTSGVSNVVKQPHVTAQLISESTVGTGKPFFVALHLHMDADWHTYWINPGDAGLATSIKWTLPPGFTAGPIQWPTPEVHKMGPLTTYGYGGDVYLLTTITPPDKIAMGVPFEVKAHADWLVCQEECIPGKGDFVLRLTGAEPLAANEAREKFFSEAKTRLPVPNTRWNVKALVAPLGGLQKAGDDRPVLYLDLEEKAGKVATVGKLLFFPEQQNILSASLADQGGQQLSTPVYALTIRTQQNGDKPDHLSGILVSDQPLIGDSKAVYLSSFATDDKSVPVYMNSLDKQTPAVAGNSVPSAAGKAETDPATLNAPAASTTAQPFLLAVLGAAFVGGLILNLMPCVLPVLSLKVFSLVRHAGHNPKSAWKQGVAFTAGVVISFWILAGLLIALRLAGNHLGWGFQMQSPGFVLGLIFLFFLLGLNLFGVFELGTSLVGLDAKAAGRAGSGLTSSFLNGALATIAATPCTAPFMGSALGFAAQQPVAISMLVFTALALGMATPYLLLTIFPGALRFVPKPGAWMEAFKQFMGFLLMATVIFLVYVFGALVGQDQVPDLLAVLLIAGVAAWIYGRWGSPIHSRGARVAAVILAFFCLGFAIDWGATLARATPPASSATAADGGWQTWSPGAVDATVAAGRPAFVDFTAAWCLSCKVNERVALESDSVKRAFAEKKVALFLADWTHSDPAISAELEKYKRDGVPLYLMYSAGKKDMPQVLPEVLTPDIVLGAVGRSGGK